MAAALHLQFGHSLETHYRYYYAGPLGYVAQSTHLTGQIPSAEELKRSLAASATWHKFFHIGFSPFRGAGGGGLALDSASAAWRVSEQSVARSEALAGAVRGALGGLYSQGEQRGQRRQRATFKSREQERLAQLACGGSSSCIAVLGVGSGKSVAFLLPPLYDNEVRGWRQQQRGQGALEVTGRRPPGFHFPLARLVTVVVAPFRLLLHHHEQVARERGLRTFLVQRGEQG